MTYNFNVFTAMVRTMTAIITNISSTKSPLKHSLVFFSLYVDHNQVWSYFAAKVGMATSLPRWEVHYQKVAIVTKIK